MDRRRGTVLFVEDDPNDVALTQRAFEQAGFVNPLHVVTDGEQAIGYLAGEGRYADRARYPLPILILLDLKLPRVSGFEVLTWLREAPGVRRLPVVVLTSSGQSPDISRPTTSAQIPTWSNRWASNVSRSSCGRSGSTGS